MRLTILGTSTPYPRPGNPCSGYLVQAGGNSVWLDAGSGTLSQLQRHIELNALDAIWISHGHADHTADLLSTFYALKFASSRRETPMPLIGPPELPKRITAFLGASAADFADVFSFTAMKQDGHQTIGELELDWRAVEHGVPAFGLRVTSTKAVMAYSGDSAPCPQLVELAQDATAFLCESGSSVATENPGATHCSPEDAGRAASQAGAERLIVTHVSGFISAEQAADRAQGVFAGPVDIARPEYVYDLAARNHLF